MKRLIPFLLLLHLTNAQLPFLSLNGGRMDFNQDGTEKQAIEKVRKWLNSMKVSLPSACAGSKDREVVPHRQLVRPIACHEPGAINRYSFTGEFDVDQKLRGRGILTINSELPVMSRCIKVLDLFGEKIESIESTFYDGLPETRALIRWHVMTGEVLLRKGMPSGFYRVERDGVWSVGALKESRIDGHCWIVVKDHILSGMCEEEPWAFSRSNLTAIQVFMHDFNVAIVGQIIDNNDGRSLLMAQDMLMGHIGGMDDCTMQIGGEGYGRAFVFDLDSLTRNYMLENSTLIDYCQHAGPASNGQTAEGDENVSAALRSYIGGLMELSLDPSPIDTKKAKKFISFLELSESDDESGGNRPNLYEAVLTLHESVSLEFFYFGKYDEDGLFHGQAILRPNTYKSCYKGECKVSKYGQIFATFEHGIVQGLVVINSPERDITTYFITKDGIIHSLVVERGLKPIYPYVIDMAHVQSHRMRILANNGVGYLGSFRNGRIDSPVWFGMVGEPVVAQSFLYGQLNKKGKLTGDDIAYIYPDYLTALVGKFEDKTMKSGRESKIVQVTCEQGLIRAKFSRPDENAVVFFYDPPTNETMGSMHLARDPYEKKTVELQESQIPGAGQGLFAIRDIPQGQVVAMYNGMVYNAEQRLIRTTSCKLNSDQSLEASKQCMKYRINGYYGALSDIPAEYDDIQVYNATLAHKTNNHFYSYVNTYFGPMEHPRFGLIVTVTATRGIKKGEEIFVNYGYGDKAIPETEWYIEQKKEVEKELEEKKRQTEEEEKRIKEKIADDEKSL